MLFVATILICNALPAFAGKIRFSYDAADRLVAADYGSNKVTTFSYDKNGNLLNRATAVATNADVRIPSVSAQNLGANAGSFVNYTIVVTNNGPNPAAGVEFTVPLTFGLLPTGASVSQGSVSVNGRLVTANLGLLVPNAGASVTISAIKTLVGSFTNVFMVSSVVPDPNPNNNRATNVVSANAAAFDQDNDGMPNWWEDRYGLGFGSSGVNGPDGDPDGDGVRNLDEWLADTRPRDASSFFAIHGFALDGAAATLTFQASPIRRYHAQFTPALDVPFTSFLTLDGDGSVHSVQHTNSTGGFYRLQAEVP